VLDVEDNDLSFNPRCRETPRRVLERLLTEALHHEPCIVAFSGGRDSSALLALAVSCAREHRLPLPVPATHRFIGCTGPQETTWQEWVVRHLALDDWIIHEWRDELDVIGPYAQDILLRWGPVYPHNAHFIVPLLENARNGSLVTGFGGDEILCAISGLRAITRSVRAKNLSTTSFNLLGVLPERVRMSIVIRPNSRRRWLTAEANHILQRELLRRQSNVRYRWAAVVDAWHQSRDRLSSRRTDLALAALHGTHIVSPFESTEFLESLASDRYWLGYRNRDEVMQSLVGDILPRSSVLRSDKAYFNEIFFSSYSRDFVAGWDGSCLDEDLALEQPLREAWAQPLVDARTLALLQRLWCDSSVPSPAVGRAPTREP